MPLTGNSNVSFYDPALEMQDIARKRKLAEALTVQNAQGLSSLGDTQMVGGWAIPKSPWESVGSLGQALSGAYGEQKLNEREKQVAENARTQQGNDVQSFASALTGTPGSASPPDELGGGPAQPAMAPDRNKALSIALQSQSPMVQGAGSSMLADMLKKPVIKHVDMGDKIGMIDDRGQLVGTFPKGNTPDAVLKDTTTRAKNDVAPSGVVFNPYKTEPGQVFNDPNKLINLGPDGKPVVNQPLVGVKKDIASAGKSVNTVNVNTEKQFLGNIGETVGKDIGTTTSNAKAAIGTLNTVGQIRQALDSGQVIAGPGTTAINYLGKIGQVIGVAGKDATEQLTQTRKVIQGLAQLELDGAQQMKGQGQITEAEREIIRRASSGDIDGMTLPELRTLTDVLDKTARYKIKTNAANVQRLRSNPNAASMVDFMNVDEPPPYVPPQPKRRASDNSPAPVDFRSLK